VVDNCELTIPGSKFSWCCNSLSTYGLYRYPRQLKNVLTKLLIGLRNICKPFDDMVCTVNCNFSLKCHASDTTFRNSWMLELLDVLPRPKPSCSFVGFCLKRVWSSVYAQLLFLCTVIPQCITSTSKMHHASGYNLHDGFNCWILATSDIAL